MFFKDETRQRRLEIARELARLYVDGGCTSIRNFVAVLKRYADSGFRLNESTLYRYMNARMLPYGINYRYLRHCMKEMRDGITRKESGGEKGNEGQTEESV